jgi:transposase
VGSEQAGPKVAAILSVVETCRRLKVPVREYLAWVLPVLGDVQVQRVRHASRPGCFPQLKMKD